MHVTQFREMYKSIRLHNTENLQDEPRGHESQDVNKQNTSTSN